MSASSPIEQMIRERAGLRLNLGCSDRHMAGYVNVDLCLPCDQVADLTKRWPWDDSSIGEIVAWDIFEHLPDIIHTMNETHRVLIPGGKLNLVVPTTDGRGAWQDPTHKSFWNLNSLFYFCQEYAEWHRFHQSYGITARFRLASVPDHQRYHNEVWKLKITLEAVK